MKNRFRNALAIAAAGAIALTGCSDPGAGTGSEGPVDWPAQDADLTGTTLTIWAAQNSNTVPDSVIAGFEELTGAKVEVVTIPDPYEQGVQTKVATGDMPDLAFWQPTASQLTALNAKQNLQPLDDAPWLDSYKPELRDITGILDDTRYAALITTPAVEGVYYNKEVFAANGITETPTDWESFLQTARDLKAAGVDPVLRDGRRPLGHPVVGAGAARRRRRGRALGPRERRRGEVHRPDHPGRDRHLQGPDRRGPVQRGHQDRDVRGPGRRAPRGRRRHGRAGQLVLRPAPVARRHRGAEPEDRLLPDLAVRQHRHVHPGPVERPGGLQDR